MKFYLDAWTQECYIVSGAGKNNVVSLSSFGRVPWFKCVSGPVVPFVNDCGIVEVNINVVKSPCMFATFQPLTPLFHIPDVFFSSGGKWSFGFANVITWTWRTKDFINNVALDVFRRSELRTRNTCCNVFTSFLVTWMPWLLRIREIGPVISLT